MALAFGIIAWATCAIVTAIIAGSRDRNPFAWLAIAAVTGIFGLILVLALPRAISAPSGSHHPLVGAGRKSNPSMTDCPDCGEPVSIAARVCDHCGTRLA
ncbi:zinc ribbon domain-containing protein [Aliirhizobium cellulosilyticum]|uniref:zinc ribbon domain-containing protein n=1 Tax=Aliirhizobium cellulosilyticum TaxID=393664 RepID=UPI001612FF97